MHVRVVDGTSLRDSSSNAHESQIEASGPDEITGDRLQEEVTPARDQGPARGFARPRRPGR
jgi:hypothetical protein